MKFTTVLKRGFMVGVAAEIAAIGGTYYLYRKYKTNQEFRERIENDYPEAHKLVKQMSTTYLSLLPDDWRRRILDDKNSAESTVNKSK